MTTLLLVEDNRILRESITLALQLQGYTVLQANNAESLFRQLREHSDVLAGVLCDVTLPDMDEQALITQLTSCKEGQFPIFFMLGSHMPNMAQLAQSLQPTEYLVKPFSAEDLMHMLAESL